MVSRILLKISSNYVGEKADTNRETILMEEYDIPVNIKFEQ